MTKQERLKNTEREAARLREEIDREQFELAKIEQILLKALNEEEKAILRKLNILPQVKKQLTFGDLKKEENFRFVASHGDGVSRMKIGPTQYAYTGHSQRLYIRPAASDWIVERV